MKASTASSWIRWLLLVVSIGVVGIAAAVSLGWARPHTPPAEEIVRLPALTLGTVIVGGLVDGVNPCAFTALLLLMAAMLAALPAGDPSDAWATRLRIIRLGSIYVAAVFLTYLALGAGVLTSVTLFSRYHLPARVAALLALGMGLWMIKDALLPEWGPRLSAPKAVAAWAVAAARRATVPALMGSGILIGLCTVPCSGAVYLAVLGLLSLQSSLWIGLVYLMLYNLMFILPLAGLLFLASARPVLLRLARWNRQHPMTVRFFIGLLAVSMGLLVLAMM
jgi:cytochrome c biogenesis protein CcdA